MKELKEYDIHDLISLLTGQALLSLGEGVKARDIVSNIANAVITWKAAKDGIPKDTKYLITCPSCGGSNVHVKAWVDANTNTYVGETDNDDRWCENCKFFV